MKTILRWGLGAGAAIALVDLLANELTAGVGDVDLAAAIVLVDLLVNLGLFGWVGYRVSGALGQVRAGLEAAVLAGVLVGVAGLAYQLSRTPSGSSTSDVVFHLAYNVVLAAGAGALGAWAGSTVRRRLPPK